MLTRRLSPKHTMSAEQMQITEQAGRIDFPAPGARHLQRIPRQGQFPRRLCNYMMLLSFLVVDVERYFWIPAFAEMTDMRCY